MSSPNPSAVELAPIREMLGVYCHALTERRVELQDLQQLVDKNIGWSKNDIATSDGAAIFLPGQGTSLTAMDSSNTNRGLGHKLVLMDLEILTMKL